MNKKRQHRTHRGRIIDMDALRMANEHSVALGNAKMNARGDILGKGGIVEKSREKQAEEYYHQQVAQQVQTNEDPAVNKPKINEEITLEQTTVKPKRPSARKKKGE